jgi:hypothetical protein
MARTTKPKSKRGPYTHAADYRDALVELDAALAQADALARWWAHHESGEAARVSASAVLTSANDMIEAMQRVRAAGRRMLVAQYGTRSARRWDGWTARRRGTP